MPIHSEPPERPTLGGTTVMTAPQSNKRAAAAAAKNLLAARITLVEELGEALDAHSKAVDAVEHARKHAEETGEATRTAFDAAKAGGWTAAELNSTGLKPPAAPRARPTTRTPPPPASTTPAPDTAAQAATSEPAA